MTLWLNSLKNPDGSRRYTVELVNTIPTAIYAIIAVTTFLAGSLAGIVNVWAMLVGIQAINLFAVTSTSPSQPLRYSYAGADMTPR